MVHTDPRYARRCPSDQVEAPPLVRIQQGFVARSISAFISLTRHERRRPLPWRGVRLESLCFVGEWVTGHALGRSPADRP